MPEHRQMIRFSTVAVGVAAAALPLALCSCNDVVRPKPGRRGIVFDPAVIDLGLARDTTVIVRNEGQVAAGPIIVVPRIVQDAAGTAVTGPRIAIVPSDIPPLNAGAAWRCALTVQSAGTLQSGEYQFAIEAQVADTVVASLDVRFRVAAGRSPVASVAFTSGPTTIRQGDVTPYTAEARDADGIVVADAQINWSVAPSDAGFSATDGRFVGYDPGTARLIATVGAAAAVLEVTITSRALSGTFTTVGQGRETDRFTSDLWVHGAVAYTGTWGGRAGGGGTLLGNTLYVWDVVDPLNPLRTDSLAVDARTVNDVKVREDGTIAVITHEGSEDGLNGVTLLDLTDPQHPSVITRFTTSLETGVHNAWIDGDYVYLAVGDPGPTGGLRILDITDPQTPNVAASYYAGTSFLHDVYVRGGLAFLSHWDAGLVILDVGSGIAGGSPANPVEVSRIEVAGGQTHNAWYWLGAGYVFVGEEDFGTPGVVHVVDVRDLRNPKEVATFHVPGDTPHNFWLDELNGVLYAAWYTNGVRALGVSGGLLGELHRQGREIVGFQYAGGGICPFALGATTCTWAPQLHNGLVFLSDIHAGLWVLRPDF